jgi:hypothetical protein
VLEQIFGKIPRNFTETITLLKTLVGQRIDREIADKQLYYHTQIHPSEVQQRTRLILQVLRDYTQTPWLTEREELLLDLCAIAHDMVQIFVSSEQPHSSRRREAGESEKATIEELLIYITQINQQITSREARLESQEIELLKNVINATICAYDPEEQSIYQPALCNSQQPVSTVALILALADIGTLGMSGISAYNQEGSLLFLEENPDIIPLIQEKRIALLEQENPELYENLRQRLLRRSRFQVNLAKSRLNRYQNELKGFGIGDTTDLGARIFPYLNQTIIKQLSETTPQEYNVSLQDLLEFFRLESLVSTIKTST